MATSNVPQVGIECLSENKFRITFGVELCAAYCCMMKDDNPFHDPNKNPDAYVPGTLILGGLDGAVSIWRPGWELARMSEFAFKKRVPVGGSILATFTDKQTRLGVKKIEIVVQEREGEHILSPATVMLNEVK